MADRYVKDPDEVLDFVRDWSAALEGDSIDTSQWLPVGFTPGADGAIAIGTSSSTATTATVWLSGGVDGEDYALTNRITTTGGRTFDHTLTFLIREK